MFTFKDPKYDLKAIELIANLNKKFVVCVHSREGDYVTDPGFSVINQNYLKSAINLLLQKLELLKNWVFRQLPP